MDNDTIAIRHSIPSHPRTPPPGTEPPSDGKSQMEGEGYLLRSGVTSPILANLFLHYAFDLWVMRHLPGVRFARYADDAVLHCKSRRQAEYV